MKPAEIAEDLNGWSRAGSSIDVPPPIDEWHFVNGRYVVDGVPFTKPQVEAFLDGLDKGLAWTRKVAEHVEEGSVDQAIDQVTAAGLLRKLLGGHVEYQPAYAADGQHRALPASLRGYDPHENLDLTESEDEFVRRLRGAAAGG